MKKKNKSMPLEELRAYDFVLVGGKINQVVSNVIVASSDAAEPGSGIVAPILLTKEDIESVKKRLKVRYSNVKISYQEEDTGFYVDVMMTVEGQSRSNFVSKHIDYYHELQHAIAEVGCKAELNYRWREIEEKKKEEKSDGRE